MSGENTACLVACPPVTTLLIGHAGGGWGMGMVTPRSMDELCILEGGGALSGHSLVGLPKSLRTAPRATHIAGG